MHSSIFATDTSGEEPGQPRRPDKQEGHSIWRNSDFRALLLGQGASNLGDAVTATALPLLILGLTHSGVQMGAVASLEAASGLLFGPVAGVLADRWNRRRVLLGASLGLAMTISLIPLTALVGGPVLLTVYVAAVPLGMLGGLFGAAYTAALPRLVDRDRLAQANSYFEAMESLAWIFGPGLAGLLVTRVGAAKTLLADVTSFLIGAAAVLTVRRPLQADTGPEHPSMRRELLTGLSYIVRHRSLRTLLLFWWGFRLVAASFVIAVTYHITVDRTMPPAILGLTISSYAAGSLVGTLLAGRMDGRPTREPVLIAGAGAGLALLILAVAGSLPLLLSGGFGFGLAEGFILVIYLTARARAVPDELLGRVSGAAMTVSTGMTPVGAMIGGVLIQLGGGVPALTAMGVTMLGLALLFSRTRVLEGATG